MKTNHGSLATAYHEAGHAFADWKFCFRVKRATVVPKGDAAGCVESKTGLHFRSLEYTNPSGARIGRLHETIVSLLAGHAAQRRFSPGSVRSIHASSDRRHAFELLVSLHSQNEIPHVWRYLEAKARNLIENPMHWRVIQHLAGELLKQQTMTGQQIEAAIRDGYQLDFEERRNKTRSAKAAKNIVQLSAKIVTI